MSVTLARWSQINIIPGNTHGRDGIEASFQVECLWHFLTWLHLMSKLIHLQINPRHTNGENYNAFYKIDYILIRLKYVFLFLISPLV